MLSNEKIQDVEALLAFGFEPEEISEALGLPLKAIALIEKGEPFYERIDFGPKRMMPRATDFKWMDASEFMQVEFDSQRRGKILRQPGVGNA